MPRPQLGAPMTVQLHRDDDGIVRDLGSSGGPGVTNSSVVRGLVHEAFEARRARASAGDAPPPVGSEPTSSAGAFTREELEGAFLRLTAPGDDALDCEGFGRLLAAYQADELAVAESISFSLHARGCGDCLALLGGATPGGLSAVVGAATQAEAFTGEGRQQ